MDFKKIVLLAAIFSSGVSYSQTLSDPAYANMQRAMGGIIQDATYQRGYIPSDPRTYSTLKSVGAAVATGALTAGTGLLIGGTAPAWGTVLGVAAVSSAVGYGVSLGIDKAVKWAFGTNQATPVTVSESGALSSGGVVSGQLAYNINGNYFSSSPQESVTQMVLSTTVFTDVTAMNLTPEPTNTTAYANGRRYAATTTGHRSDMNSANVYTNYTTYYVSYTPAPITCPPGFVVVTGLCVTTRIDKYAPAAVPSSVVSLTDAINRLTAVQKQQKLSYEAMALIINENWKKAAAQPAYAGVPYSVTNPVTAEQVEKWAQKNPTSYPTVEELTKPVTNSPAGFAPSTTTSSSTAVNPATSNLSPNSTNASITAEVNLGPDPNILPQTPETPSADSIFEPLLSIARPFINFQINAPEGECPRPQFEVFGRTIGMTQHCDILGNLRGTIQAVMSAVFTVAALLIVFSA